MEVVVMKFALFKLLAKSAEAGRRSHPFICINHHTSLSLIPILTAS